jgi:hypothetical protein
MYVHATLTVFRPWRERERVKEQLPSDSLSAHADRDRESASPRASPREAAQTSPRKGATASSRATGTAPPASLRGRLADRAHALARAAKEASEGEEEDSDEKEEVLMASAEEDAQVSAEDEGSEDSEEEEEEEEVEEEEGEPATASTGGGVMAPERPTAKQVLKKLSFFHKGTGGGGGGGGGGGEGWGRGEVGGGWSVGAGLGSVVARSLRDFEMAGGDGKGKRVSMWAAASAAPSSSHALAQEVGLKSGLKGYLILQCQCPSIFTLLTTHMLTFENGQKRPHLCPMAPVALLACQKNKGRRWIHCFDSRR